DEESGLISDEQGEPFFDSNGELAKPTREVMEFLKKVEQNRLVIQKAVDALSQAEVLSPWQPKIRKGEEESNIPGLLRIDEDKLNRLEDQAYLHLREAGALYIGYAQLFSMGNIGILKKLAEFREQEKAKVQKQAEPDIEKLFGEDDLIKFGDE
ncbi:MAG: SapC family protein, partial [Desulfovermiculus sp.]